MATTSPIVLRSTPVRWSATCPRLVHWTKSRNSLPLEVENKGEGRRTTDEAHPSAFTLHPYSKTALRTWHIVAAAGILAGGLPERFGDCLKDRLGDVVIVRAIRHVDVQVHLGIARQR